MNKRDWETIEFMFHGIFTLFVLSFLTIISLFITGFFQSQIMNIFVIGAGLLFSLIFLRYYMWWASGRISEQIDKNIKKRKV